MQALVTATRRLNNHLPNKTKILTLTHNTINTFPLKTSRSPKSSTTNPSTTITATTTTAVTRGMPPSPAEIRLDISYDTRAKSTKPFSAIPGPTGIYNIPYLGFLFHLKPFDEFSIETIHLLFNKMLDRHGPIFKIKTTERTVVITDPKDVATVLQNQGKYPFRPNFDIFDVYYRRTGNKPNMGGIQGEDWWRLRQPMQRLMLRPNNLSLYLNSMEGVIDDFVDMLSDGYLKHPDVERRLMAFVSESVGTVFFNKRLGFLDEIQSKDSKDMMKATIDIFDIMLKSLLGSSVSYRFYRSAEYRRFEEAQTFIHELIGRYVDEASEEIKRMEKTNMANVDDSHVLFGLLKRGVPKDDVILITEALYFAAIDSSASTFQLIFYLLATHPDKQEKLRQEILKVLAGDVHNDKNNSTSHDIDGSSSSSSISSISGVRREHITRDMLDQMHYLKACVKEVYRYLNVLPFGFVRVLPQDVVLSGYNVPAGVPIINYIVRACHDRSLFENPDQYIPERWLRSRSDDSHEFVEQDRDRNWAVLPFGLGSRSCPGKRLFEHEVYLTLAKILTRLRIGLELGSDQKVEFEYRTFLKPKTPIQFTFTPLDRKQI